MNKEPNTNVKQTKSTNSNYSSQQIPKYAYSKRYQLVPKSALTGLLADG